MAPRAVNVNDSYMELEGLGLTKRIIGVRWDVFC